jgi:hypothetical protein
MTLTNVKLLEKHCVFDFCQDCRVLLIAVPNIWATPCADMRQTTALSAK